jgi:Arc/MetJ-type ribon-helix-helix transcriptional regulator
MEVPMKVSLNPESSKLVQQLLREKKYASAEDAVHAALLALQHQQPRREFPPGEWDRLLAEGEASAKAEGLVSGEEVFARIQRRSAARRAKAKAG